LQLVPKTKEVCNYVLYKYEVANFLLFFCFVCNKCFSIFVALFLIYKNYGNYGNRPY
jgi:hypothetical protein